MHTVEPERALPADIERPADELPTFSDEPPGEPADESADIIERPETDLGIYDDTSPAYEPIEHESHDISIGYIPYLPAHSPISTQATYP